MADDRLVQFLSEAGNKLGAFSLEENPTTAADCERLEGEQSKLRFVKTNSAICILDNVCEGGANETVKRQKVRSSKDMESLFTKAGLQIYYCTEETVVQEDFLKMKIWLLSKYATVKPTILENVSDNAHGSDREDNGSSQVN